MINADQALPAFAIGAHSPYDLRAACVEHFAQRNWNSANN